MYVEEFINKDSYTNPEVYKVYLWKKLDTLIKTGGFTEVYTSGYKKEHLRLLQFWSKNIKSLDILHVLISLFYSLYEDCEERTQKKCPNCEGKGKQSCETCMGTGDYFCNSCRSTGVNIEGVSCNDCSGYGVYDCTQCNGDGHTGNCNLCKGTGFVYEIHINKTIDIEEKHGDLKVLTKRYLQGKEIENAVELYCKKELQKC